MAAPQVLRPALTQQQQQLGQQGGLVAEGRDIGTAVFPDAELKIYLTATVAERARRRAADLTSRGLPVPELSQLEQEIADRDHKDSTREVAPLRQASDAVELLSDGLSIEEVVAQTNQVLQDPNTSELIPHMPWSGHESCQMPDDGFEQTWRKPDASGVRT